jgi:hypothetical protein
VPVVAVVVVTPFLSSRGVKARTVGLASSACKFRKSRSALVLGTSCVKSRGFFCREARVSERGFVCFSFRFSLLFPPSHLFCQKFESFLLNPYFSFLVSISYLSSFFRRLWTLSRCGLDASSKMPNEGSLMKGSHGFCCTEDSILKSALNYN